MVFVALCGYYSGRKGKAEPFSSLGGSSAAASLNYCFSRRSYKRISCQMIFKNLLNKE
jgi:hypothetical protein